MAKKAAKKTTSRRKPAPKKTDSPPRELTTTNHAPAYQVLQWMLEGHDERQMTEALRELHPKADIAEALRVAMLHLETVGAADPSVIRGWVFEAYRRLYQKAVEMDDIANALRAVKELSKLTAGDDG